MNKIYPSKVVGIYILLLGMIILFKILFAELFTGVHIILIILTVASLDLTIRGLFMNKRKFLLIPGIIIFLTCIFLLIYIFFIDPHFNYFANIWPVMSSFPAISLIVFYLRSSKKRTAIIVPGIFLLILSIILLLFTTHIITLKFTTFLLLLIPSMIIITGLYLIFRNELEIFKKKIKKKHNQNP
jgi:hypothetical protein